MSRRGDRRRGCPNADTAAERCARALGGDAATAVAERVTEYASERTWRALRRNHSAAGCKEMAELARGLLAGFEKIHNLIAHLVDRALVLLGRNGAERMFARELATRIPLPLEDQVRVAARGLQVAGIWLCLSEGIDLLDCACMRSVLMDEGSEFLDQLVSDAVGDWQYLPAGPPQSSAR